ncbi:hypothetical protein KQX54_010937 [Cotesia glomerata]|uniref:Uncharacterized protein n=1 Tax=Cotesia glomerata TaxID=32391 RepID=A0AAV7J9B5_COTGL|nr:hypothetical protein KQX54_010937 [Cotesia glomerata]
MIPTKVEARNDDTFAIPRSCFSRGVAGGRDREGLPERDGNTEVKEARRDPGEGSVGSCRSCSGLAGRASISVHQP